MNVQFIELAARRYADVLKPYGITAEFSDEFLANITAMARIPADEDVLECTNDWVMEKK